MRKSDEKAGHDQEDDREGQGDDWLLDTLVGNTLINPTQGFVDDSVDGFPKNSHIGGAELCRTIVNRAL
ncbi:hypothetical protein [Aliiroseovarius sp.]|uniref:hypothetical protein n=1 Tax=Aliiroseovarius sp. TaxID=1872442 RepID=UPI002605BB41|nr:hypothetical protein [Aliiroseovarius sp.]